MDQQRLDLQSMIGRLVPLPIHTMDQMNINTSLPIIATDQENMATIDMVPGELVAIPVANVSVPVSGIPMANVPIQLNAQPVYTMQTQETQPPTQNEQQTDAEPPSHLFQNEVVQPLLVSGQQPVFTLLSCFRILCLERQHPSGSV